MAARPASMARSWAWRQWSGGPGDLSRRRPGLSSHFLLPHLTECERGDLNRHGCYPGVTPQDPGAEDHPLGASAALRGVRIGRYPDARVGWKRCGGGTTGHDAGRGPLWDRPLRSMCVGWSRLPLASTLLPSWRRFGTAISRGTAGKLLRSAEARGHVRGGGECVPRRPVRRLRRPSTPGTTHAHRDVAVASLLVVVHAEKRGGEILRIISARRATRHERRRYEEEG